MREEEFKDKRILFVSPPFFNYYKYISDELTGMDAIVHYYDERNHPSSIEKIIYRTVPQILVSKVRNYYSGIIEKEKDFHPDYVLFNSPESVDELSVKRMKQAFPEAKFILYMWDSLENKNAKNVYQLFDRTLSFDQNDCRKYHMTFRPLFYIKTMQAQRVDSYKYDFSFIGTIHSDRAEILYKLKQYCDAHGLTYYYYLYIPGNLLYTMRKATDGYVRKLEKYIHLEPTDKKTIAEISENTRCVIDINHPKQTGLTMRTIEMLGLHQKILTTNQNVKGYDFYEPGNQLVISRDEIKIDKDLLAKPYTEVPEEVYEKYSIHSFVMDIFDENTKKEYLR
ncbi:MAG: capsular biosynthesis protein CpsH [Lachnospiraceae bacterium]|nr:capsular biosynthesis protein CpsH [Lachnospiraceae bacterium]